MTSYMNRTDRRLGAIDEMRKCVSVLYNLHRLWVVIAAYTVQCQLVDRGARGRARARA